MKKFPSIVSFTLLVRACRAHAAYINVPVETLAPINYVGTVKLHGTNGGVCVKPDGTIVPQSREQELDLVVTNAGFATFVLTREAGVFEQLACQLLELNGIDSSVQRTEDVTIFGEWCGGSIQKGVALNQVPKHFVIFRVALGEVQLEKVDGVFAVEHGIYNITQVPTYNLTVKFDELQAASDYINEVTVAVEQECPWAKLMFDVTGTGEGVVWVPTARADETNLWFKSKGEKHKVRNSPTKDVAPVDVEKVNSIKECVDIVLTVNRMEQMVRDNNLPFEVTSIGPFLQAVAKDILKEESHVLIDNGLDWKDVGKLVQSMARTWFMEQIHNATFS